MLTTDPSEPVPTILVVEDDQENRMLLSELLKRSGYAVKVAVDGYEALRKAFEPDVDAILLDIGLPELDGYQVCERLRDDPTTLLTPIIMLTGLTETDDLVRGLDAGADDFLSKPYKAPELLARIRSALRLRRAIADMEAAHGVVAALANAVEAKDVTTENHCQRLAGLAHHMGLALELDGVALKSVVFGALLHDVGKIGVPESILAKTGPLSDHEWEVMKEHPAIGEQICRPLVSSRMFTPIVRHHHERWDGTGYPDGLKGDAIPLGARIVTLVDAFDAMVHDRPYRRGVPVERALDAIHIDKGKQFDPDLVPLFVRALTPGHRPLPLVPASLAGRHDPFQRSR